MPNDSYVARWTGWVFDVPLRLGKVTPDGWECFNGKFRREFVLNGITMGIPYGWSGTIDCGYGPNVEYKLANNDSQLIIW